MSEYVVPPSWVESHDARVVDVRDAWEFDGIGHLPDAVNIPFDAFRGEDGEAGKLPGADVFAELLSEAGITTDDHLLAYDDTHGVFAARFLVTALLYGHDPAKLHLLDGDFSAWQREGRVSREQGEWEASEYTATFQEDGPLIPYEEVTTALEEDALLVDTREPAEYEAGHLPGAVQVDWRELVDDDTRGLKPEAELREILESRGITPDRRIVLYCNTARRISHTYFVLRQLGYANVEFYEGSLTEWEARGGPIER
ncbi:sulfurtransferase [Natronomonas sp. EA1]|uniref:sulfurtransferase n=1 Tax=Natronomonas sp. EA1 TaxID=3421655 RepID=UPI003EBC2C86